MNFNMDSQFLQEKLAPNASLLTSAGRITRETQFSLRTAEHTACWNSVFISLFLMKSALARLMKTLTALVNEVIGCAAL